MRDLAIVVLAVVAVQIIPLIATCALTLWVMNEEKKNRGE